MTNLEKWVAGTDMVSQQVYNSQLCVSVEPNHCATTSCLPTVYTTQQQRVWSVSHERKFLHSEWVNNKCTIQPRQLTRYSNLVSRYFLMVSLVSGTALFRYVLRSLIICITHNSPVTAVWNIRYSADQSDSIKHHDGIVFNTVMLLQTDRQRDREPQTHRKTGLTVLSIMMAQRSMLWCASDRETDRQTERQTESHRHTDSLTDRQTSLTVLSILMA